MGLGLLQPTGWHAEGWARTSWVLSPWRGWKETDLFYVQGSWSIGWVPRGVSPPDVIGQGVIREPATRHFPFHIPPLALPSAPSPSLVGSGLSQDSGSPKGGGSSASLLGTLVATGLHHLDISLC